MTTDLLWPGLHRAGDLFNDAAVAAAMVHVEAQWLSALARVGLATPEDADRVASVTISQADLAAIAEASEGGGNPLIPLLTHLRSAAPGPVHLALTSQDVVDTALVLCARDCLAAVLAELDAQVEAVAGLADAHRRTLMTARTLGQAAVPTTFGVRVAGWLRGLVAARAAVRDRVAALTVQVGGAGGTMAAAVEVCRVAGSADPAAAARGLVDDLARRLVLAPSDPWHTSRFPVTRIGDTLVEVSDALGHVANDVVIQSRPEIGELSEPSAAGRGGSSAMPQKRNPVLSVLIRRHALSAPLLGAQLHLAAAAAVDERPDGAWHAEWATLRDLARRTVVAAREATELLQGLEVHADAMQGHVDAAMPGLVAERAAVVEKASGHRIDADARASLLDPTAYLGLTDQVIDSAIDSATAAETATARTE